MSTYAAFFSPTGNSRRCAEAAAARITPAYRTLDLTFPEGRSRRDFRADDRVFLALPVYGGRLPALPGPASSPLASLHGNGAALCALVTYGGRAYDDALLELADAAEERGFRVAAAGAFAAPHSFSPRLGSGRPDARDREALAALADAFARRCEAGELARPSLPGNEAYRDRSPMPWAPEPTENCLECGSCADVCPVRAIEREAPFRIRDAALCIHCHACVKACPAGGRNVLAEAFHQKIAMLEAAFADVRREAEIFV